MKEAKYIVGFLFIGLLVAYFVGSPLRDQGKGANIGTPLQSAPIYAEGTIQVEPGLEALAKDKVALFVIARAAAAGAPLAVRKYEFPSFPLKFSLTQNHNIVGDNFYSGELKIIARLDQDGMAGAKQPEDLEGVVEIKEGQTRLVNITLSK